MVFLVVMYRCESWTIKKVEHPRIDAFELWCWRRFLRVPWMVRRSNESILKKINPKYSLKGLMLKLKLRYFDHLMQRTTHWKRPWCWERLKTEGEGKYRGWDGWMASLTQWTWVRVNSGRRWRTGKLDVLQSMESQRVGRDWATERQQHADKNIIVDLTKYFDIIKLKHSKLRQWSVGRESGEVYWKELNLQPI